MPSRSSERSRQLRQMRQWPRSNRMAHEPIPFSDSDNSDSEPERTVQRARPVLIVTSMPWAIPRAGSRNERPALTIPANTESSQSGSLSVSRQPVGSGDLASRSVTLNATRGRPSHQITQSSPVVRDVSPLPRNGGSASPIPAAQGRTRSHSEVRRQARQSGR